MKASTAPRPGAALTAAPPDYVFTAGVGGAGDDEDDDMDDGSIGSGGMACRTCVIVLSRAPQRGRCKTRLARRIGAVRATAMHCRLADRTLAILRQAQSAALVLACTPSPRHAYFAHCRRRHPLRLARQARGDLGRRMRAALNSALQQGFEAALVVGTDAADLSAEDVLAALAALRESPAVLQPAADGGYVLLGASVPLPALRGIDWSSGREASQTVQRLRRAGLAARILDQRRDVDGYADFLRARRSGCLPAW